MHEKSILAVYKKNKIYTQLFTGSWKLPCTGNLRRPHLKTTNKNWVAKFERAFATSWQSWLIPLLASRWHCLCCLTISRMRYWAIAAGYVFFFFFLILFYYRLLLYWPWWTYCYYFLETPEGLCGSWKYQQSVHRHSCQLLLCEM